MSKVVKYILIFFILIGVYFFLLTITSLIPSKVIEKNVREGSEVLEKDGMMSIYDLKYKKEILLSFSDAVMLNTAYSIDSKHPVESFILARKNYIPKQTKKFKQDKKAAVVSERFENDKDASAVEELYDLMHTNKIKDSFEYARYWHGYLIILRPLLVLFNYSTINIIMFIICLLCLISICYLLYKKIDLSTALIFLFGLLSVSIFVVSQSINEFLVFLISFIGILFLLKFKDKIKDIGVFFFIIGSLTSFLELLTAPIISFGLCAFVYFLLLQKDNSEIDSKSYIKEFIKIGFLWCLGYIATWGVKWIITEVFFNRNIISKSLNQVVYRISMKSTKNSINSFDVLFNVLINLSLPFLIILSISFICIIINFISSYKNKKLLNKCFPYLMLSVVPLLWIIIVKQHSYTHPYFAYRTFCITIVSFLTIIKVIYKKDN